MAERTLVTGGAGFIGSHLVDRLLAHGHEVTVLDNLSTGDRANLAHLADKVALIEADIRDLETCQRVCRGQRFVFHQAAQGSVPKSVADPATANANNITGTLNMLIAARDAGVDRLVFAASSSAYGNTEVLPKVETMSPRPLSPYAVQKVTCEHYCSAFYASYGLQTISLRYFNIFGPRQRPDGPYAAVVPKFFEAAFAARPAKIFGDGEQTRDFTYIGNAVDANLLALTAPVEAFGRVFNVAGGERISINQLHSAIGELTGCDKPAEHGPTRAGDVRDSLADIDSARAALGYAPKTTWREGLRQTFEAWQAR